VFFWGISEVRTQEQPQMKIDPKLAPQVGRPKKDLSLFILPKIDGNYWSPGLSVSRYEIIQSKNSFTIYWLRYLSTGTRKTVVATGQIIFKKLPTHWEWPGKAKVYQEGAITKMSSAGVAEEIVWPDGRRFVRQ